MSFNRLIYDKCAYQQSLKESMRPGVYQTYFGKHDNKNNCRIDFGLIGGNNVSVYRGNIVDLESDLRGQTKQASLCSNKKFMPRYKQTYDSGLPSGNIDCHTELKSLPTCSFTCYKPVVYAPLQTVSVCNDIYKEHNRQFRW